MRAAGRVPPGASAGLHLLPVSCFLPEWSVFSQMRPINGHSSFDSEVTCGRCRPLRARGHLPLVVLTGGDGSLNAGSGRGARSPPPPRRRAACMSPWAGAAGQGTRGGGEGDFLGRVGGLWPESWGAQRVPPRHEEGGGRLGQHLDGASVLPGGSLQVPEAWVPFCRFTLESL